VNELERVITSCKRVGRKKGVKINYLKQDFGSKTEPLIFNGKCKIPLQTNAVTLLCRSIVATCNLKVVTPRTEKKKIIYGIRILKMMLKKKGGGLPPHETEKWLMLKRKGGRPPKTEKWSKIGDVGAGLQGPSNWVGD
jgi:hypothetical protein